jgi:hypothetical protein
VIDLTGKLLIELRDDVAVDAIVDGRVRGFEPEPGDSAWALDNKGNRTYARAFVVIVALGSPRDRRVPIQRPRFAVRCYGRTSQEAMALYGACSSAIHDKGPRVHTNGAGIYASSDETGGDAEKDPDTQQPLVTFIAELIGTTQVVSH